MKQNTYKLLLAILASLVLAGCAAEVGSDEWCAEMKEKPKGDWTMNEASDFARHCLFK